MRHSVYFSYQVDSESMVVRESFFEHACVATVIPVRETTKWGLRYVNTAIN